MQIEVKLYSGMKKFAPGKQSTFTMSIRQGATVGDAIASLAIPTGVKKVVLLNGRRAADETPLKEASCLVLFPPISGG